MMESKENAFRVITEQLQEKSIITFKWLSRLLEIHSTPARNFLVDFMKEKSDMKFKVCYLLCAKKNNGELLLMLTCSEHDTELNRKQIEVIDRSIYSIQKIDSEFDSAMVYNVDKATYKLQSMSLSSINYHKPIVPIENREPAENSVLRGVENVSTKKEKIAKPTLNTKNVKKSPVKLSNESLKATIPATKNDHTKSSVSDKKQKVSKSLTANKSSSTIAKFFQICEDGSGTPKEGKMGKELSVETSYKIESKTDKCMNDENERCTKNCTRDETKTMKKTEKELQSNKRSSAASRKTSKKKSEKKMKRIIIPQDSDSGEESDHGNEPFEIEAEPEWEEPAKPAVGKFEDMPRVKIIDGKKRKRKIVEHCTTDEEGYFYTQKEVVYESCESEEEEKGNERECDSHTSKRPKPEAPVPAPVQVCDLSSESKKPAVKKKQASILNFFKKPRTS